MDAILKRTFDILFSVLVLILLFPLFIVITLSVKFSSQGPILFKQQRVGLNGKPFFILKFRTMFTGSDKTGLLTVGERDNRVTRVGFALRKYKLDELPQFINVLLGEMSIVGPRPEVQKYVDLYSDEQRNVLTLKPGITDYASIKYSDESRLLALAANPEKEYITNIMPAKLKLNLEYVKNKKFTTDVKIIYATLAKIMTSH